MNNDNFRSFRMQKPEPEKSRKKKYKPFPDSIMDVVHNIASGLWYPGKQCLQNNFHTNKNVYIEETYCYEKCVGEQRVHRERIHAHTQ